MPPAEARSQLNHAGSVRSDADLGVGRPVADAERLGGGAGGLDRSLCFRNTRPDVRQRDAERGRVGGDAVGDEQRVEDAVDRDGVDRHLRAFDELLDEADLAAGGVERGVDRRRQLRLGADEREAALALAVGRLDDARDRQPVDDAGDELRARLRHARLREPVALPRLRRRERRGGRVDRVRQRQPLGDARRDADRPVGARRDDPVDVLRPCEPVDAGLVLGRDDRALVRVREAGRRGVAVDGDHEEVALACGAQQPDLRGPRA